MINHLNIEAVKKNQYIYIRCALCGERAGDKVLRRKTGVPLLHMCSTCMQELGSICTESCSYYKDSGTPLPVGKVYYDDVYKVGDYAYITVDNKVEFISSADARLILKGWRGSVDPNSISAMTDVPANVVEWLMSIWDRDMRKPSKNSSTSSSDINNGETVTTVSF